MKEFVIRKLISFYRIIFLNKIFYKFNKLLFSLSLRGMGILNYENDRLSGEDWFLRWYVKNRENLLVFDVGANIGNYSNKIKSLAPSAIIYAFEPHPISFSKLILSASKYGYTAFNFGFSDSEGIIKLYDYKEHHGSSHASIYLNVIKQIHKSKETSWDIKVTTIDNFVKERMISRINLLKIDTEGNELKILQGAQKTIREGIIDIIQFEFNEMNVISRVFFKDFYDLLSSQYHLYRLLPNGLIFLNKYSPVYFEIFAYQNIVAIRKGLKI